MKFLLWAFLSAILWGLTGCSHELERVDGPIYHCDDYDITPDSVDMHTGMILRACGDSAIMVRVEGNTLRTIRCDGSHRSRGTFRYKSDYPLIDALLRLETSRGLDEIYTLSTPYELFLNPFVGAEGEGLLNGRMRNEYLIPSQTRRYCWPVINDNPQWILAACEIFKITANRYSLERIARLAANTATVDRTVCRGDFTGLISGIPRYMAAPQEIFPSWIGSGELSQAATFSVNAAWWAALKSMQDIAASMALRNERAPMQEMSIDPDSLRSLVFRHFWNPTEGRFCAMLYGHAIGQLQLGASDNLAQGLAIITGLPLQGMSEMMVAKTPAPVTGVSLFSPRLSRVFGKNLPSEALARVIWAVASSRVGNDKAYNAAVGALLYGVCNEVLGGRHALPALRYPLATLVLRGICGITTAFEGLYFAPCVPSGMPGTKRVEGLRYRKSELSITINGIGNRLVSFTIDGKETEPFYPANEEGRHEIVVTLSSDMKECEADFSDPGIVADPPVVEWTSPQDASFFVSGVDDRNVKRLAYVNGIPVDEVSSRHYRIDDVPFPSTVQFCMVEEGHSPGFATPPHLYLPPEACRTVELAGVARKGSRILEDRKLGERFVESTKYRNRRIAFDVTVPEKGVYAVDVHYVNGLGIVNPRRRTALRRLVVDGNERGIFVFTQLSPVDWDNDPSRDWQMMTGFTNPLKVPLDSGRHMFELRYYQPNPVYIDPFSNTVVADQVRIMRCE